MLMSSTTRSATPVATPTSERRAVLSRRIKFFVAITMGIRVDCLLVEGDPGPGTRNR